MATATIILSGLVLVGSYELKKEVPEAMLIASIDEHSEKLYKRLTGLIKKLKIEQDVIVGVASAKTELSGAPLQAIVHEAGGKPDHLLLGIYAASVVY